MAFQRAVILGSNGWYDTETGHTVSIMLEYDDLYLVLDAGSGFSFLEKYLQEEKPLFLFLSHFHLDHVIGLHTLGRLSGIHEMTIFGQRGSREVLSTLLASPFTAKPERLSYSLAIKEVPEESADLPFNHRVALLNHADPCLGIRIEHGGAVITFCTDTGYCSNAVDLARDADLLFTECGFPPGFERPEWPHLNPESAARIANEAGAGRLVLVHFDAFNYPRPADRQMAEEVAGKTFPATRAAVDFMEITL